MRAKAECTICNPALFAENGRRTISPCDGHLGEAIKSARLVMSRDGIGEEQAVSDELVSMQHDAEWYGTPRLAELFDRCEAAYFDEEVKLHEFHRSRLANCSDYEYFELPELYGVDDQAHLMKAIDSYEPGDDF